MEGFDPSKDEIRRRLAASREKEEEEDGITPEKRKQLQAAHDDALKKNIEQQLD
jgi:hypothetical protein